MEKLTRIAVFLGREEYYERQTLKGICRFSASRPWWRMRIARPSKNLDFDEISRWNPHGIIADLTTAEVNPFRAFDCHLVNLWGNSKVGDVRVVVDDAAVGQMAAEHFLRRGFRNFGWLGTSQEQWSVTRRNAYASVLAGAGYDCSQFSLPENYPQYIRKDLEWPGIAELFAWVDELAKSPDKPVAVFCSNDKAARELADVCAEKGVGIPEKISILGADDDDIWCRMGGPQLSSVVVPWDRLGYEAARSLDALVSGNFESFDKVIKLSPAVVTTRQSSDLMAVEDPNLGAALRYIEQHACDPIQVDDVLRVVPSSRRWLERQFKRILGRSIHAEIRRLQIEKAKNLLLRTDLSTPEIAERSGLNPKHFAKVFSGDTGLTPTAFRASVRTEGGPGR